MRRSGSDGEQLGRLEGVVRVRGAVSVPQIDANLALHDLVNEAVHVPELRAELRGDASGVRIENGSLATTIGEGLAWLDFEGEIPLRLSANARPYFDEEKGVQLVVETAGEIDLAPVADVVEAVSAATGKLRMRMVADGDFRAPRLTGQIVIRDGTLRLRDIVEELRELEVDAHFEDQRLVVDRSFARQGEKGELRATGEVRFTGLKPDDVVADFDVHRVLVLSVPFLRAIVSSRQPLHLELRRPLPGGPRVPHVGGTLVVDKARYEGEFTQAEGSGGGVLEATSTPPWLADVEIRLSDQVRISNSIAELRLSGDVDLTRDLSGLRLRGTTEIASGRVSVARLLDFEITDGRLDFSRGENLEPVIDITAETEVPVYDQAGVGRELEHVTVHVGGTFAEPQLSFTSRSGYDEKTIINLLAGIPVDAGAEQAQIQDLALRMAGNELTGALADVIGPVDTIEIDTRQTVGDDAASRARIGVGKYLDVADQPLYLRYSQGLSIAERDVYLEYQLRRRWLLTFEVRRRLRESVAHTEVNADLKFRVEY